MVKEWVTLQVWFEWWTAFAATSTRPPHLHCRRYLERPLLLLCQCPRPCQQGWGRGSLVCRLGALVLIVTLGIPNALLPHLVQRFFPCVAGADPCWQDITVAIFIVQLSIEGEQCLCIVSLCSVLMLYFLGHWTRIWEDWFGLLLP